LEQVADLLKFSVIGGLVDCILLRESITREEEEEDDENDPFHNLIFLQETRTEIPPAELEKKFSRVPVHLASSKLISR
jgi:hypothetical protein